MTSLGSLRVELELDDGSFTTRVIRAGTTLRQLQTQVGKTIVEVRRLDSGFAVAGAAVRDFTLTLGLARAAIENIYTVFGQWAASILQTSGEIQRLTSLLEGMSKATNAVDRLAEGRESTRWIMDLAQRAPFALNNLSTAFVKLRSAGIEPANDMMEALVDSVARFGGSSQTLDRAAVAIQQMAGKGVISMEELRQQLGEAIPSVIPMMARALGTTVDELVQKISMGRVRAAPALEALRREMSLTFGGSAQRLMNNFNGQLDILRTNFQRLQLAAGGFDDQGNILQGGFLATSTQAIKNLNEALAGPEARGFAVGVGLALTDLVKSLEGAVNFFIRFREEITLFAQVLGGLAVLRLTTGLIMTLGAALNALTLGLATKTAAIVAANFATLTYAATLRVVIPLVAAIPAAFAGMIAAGGIMATFAAAIAKVTAVLVPFAVGLAGAAGLGLAAGITAIAGALNAVTVAGAAVGVVMTGVYAAFAFGISKLVTSRSAVDGMTSTVGSLGSALESVSQKVSEFFTVDMMAAVSRLGDRLSNLYQSVTRLVSDPDADLRRAEFGATDAGTISGLERDVARLQTIAKEAREARASVQAAMASGAMANQPFALPNVQGYGLTETSEGGYVRGAQLSSRSAQYARMVEEAETKLAQRQVVLRAARSARAEQLARIEGQREIQQIQRNTEVIRAAYDNQAREVQQAIEGAYASRNARDPETGNFIMSPEQLTERLNELRQAGVDNASNAADAIVAAWQEGLSKFNERNGLGEALTALTRAMANRARLTEQFNAATTDAERETIRENINVADQEIDTLQARVTQLNAVAKQLEDGIAAARRLAAESRNGITLQDTETDGGRDLILMRQAETLLRNLRTSAVEARGEITGIGSNLARINQLLLDNRYGNIGDLAAELRQAATDADAARQALKTFRDAQRAMDRIDTGLGEATSDLNRYRDALEDPSLPDAQRAFVVFQRQMFLALQQVADQAGDMSQAYFEAANKVMQALNMARQAADLGSIEDYVKGTDRFAVQATERGQDRLRAQTALLQRQRDQLLEANRRSMAEGGQDRTAQITEGYNARLAAAAAEAARSGRGAARSQENDITRLTARLAELKASVHGWGEEEAKVRAELERNRQVATDYGRQMLTLASQVDEVARQAEDARNAWSGLRDLGRQGREATARMGELAQMLDNPNLSEGNRQLLAAQSGATSRIAALREAGVDVARLTQEEAKAREAVSRIAGALAMQEGIQMRRQTREIRANLAETTAQRRFFALQNVDIERQQQQSLIEHFERGSAQRIQLEENLATFIAQRRAQAIRETEEPLDRMVREWGDRWGNMENLAASSLDRLGDAFVDFAETGKFEISELATWFAKELLRMELRAQASSLLKNMGGAGGIASMIGGLIGGGASAGAVWTAGSTGASNAAGSFGFASPYHTGGIAGMPSAMGERLAPTSLWDNAPRFHDGTYLKSNEVAAILEKGEAVFTAEQTAAIGRLNHSYSIVEQTVSRIAANMNMPQEATPRSAVMIMAPANGNNASNGPVTVNIINRSDQPLEASAQPPRFDAEGMIIDVVVNAIQRPGRMRDAFRSAA